MPRKKTSAESVRGIDAFVSPAQCVNDIVQAWTEYLKIAEEEKTKRRAIEAWEKNRFAEIKAKRDLLIGYLEYSFDERAKNFQSLFQVVTQAMASGDNQQLSLALDAVVELAKSSPFKDLADLSTVQAALNDPDHVWEL
jgi:ribonucleotide reductase alpha subunit